MGSALRGAGGVGGTEWGCGSVAPLHVGRNDDGFMSFSTA